MKTRTQLDQHAHAVRADGSSYAIATWVNHTNLHAWMEQLYRKKGGEGEFLRDYANKVSVEITEEDLDELDVLVESSQLPQSDMILEPWGGKGIEYRTTQADRYYYGRDRDFVHGAKHNNLYLNEGMTIIYTCYFVEHPIYD